MLDALRKFFDRRLADAEPGHDSEQAESALQLATAALLVEMKRADDGDATDDAEMRAVLAKHFELSDDDVDRLVALAHDRADRSVSLHEFTRLIHAHFNAAQKATVIEMLWRVAYADGRVGAHEDALVRKVGDLLYVPQAAFIKAKERAARP